MRRIGFGLALAVLAFGVVEALSYTTSSLLDGAGFSPAASDALRRELTEVAAPVEWLPVKDPGRPAAWSRLHAIHPYFGFAIDPEKGGGSTGFRNAGFPRDRRSVRVVILGGSVAYGLVQKARTRIERALERSPAYAGRKVHVLNYSLPGSKQPQQLMVLNYLLAEGKRPDVVINLDGFNEVTVPLLDHRRRGVAAMYPQGWEMRVGSFEDPATRRLVGRITYLRELRAGLAGSCAHPPLRWSPTCDLVWQRVDRVLAADLKETQEQLGLRASERRSFRSHGPDEPGRSPAEYVDYITGVWMQSSLLMHQISAARDVRYFHFLQPNQYVDGSKPMGAEERFRAFVPGSGWHQAVSAAYPSLAFRGELLAAAGVAFHDLRMLFVDHPEPLYSDRCCHLRLEGTRLLADRIVDVVGRPAPGALPERSPRGGDEVEGSRTALRASPPR
jgi:hypothetical protein